MVHHVLPSTKAGVKRRQPSFERVKHFLLIKDDVDGTVLLRHKVTFRWEGTKPVDATRAATRGEVVGMRNSRGPTLRARTKGIQLQPEIG